MLEVIYRIYEITNKYEYGFDKKEIEMNCIICDNRDNFKAIIRSNYGDDILFRQSKKLAVGDIYCVIIGEHCYNTERYFTKVEYKCDNCDSNIIAYCGNIISFNDWEIKDSFYNIDEYRKKKFCSNECKNHYKHLERKNIRPNDDNEFWIERDMFKDDKINGYIYKITRLSTGEFYIGQTNTVPVFRWGQHLKSDRFPVENILDYKFETLHVVKSNENILEVEKEYIKEYSKQYSELCLNIVHNK